MEIAISEAKIEENRSESISEGQEASRLAALYDEYAARLYGYLLTITCSGTDAEDLLQELFIRLAKSNFENKNIRKLRSYLFTSARNLAIEYIRKRVREKRKLSDFESILERNSGSDISEDQLEQLNAALTDLPVEQREVMVLKTYEDMTFKQIAKFLNVSANTAASRYRYALEKMKVFLKKKNEVVHHER